MKKILILLTTLSCACGTQHTEPATEASQPVADGTTAATMQQDSTVKADAVSGATAVANSPSFNGTLILPPQNHATVTLTMDGSIRATSLTPGAYVHRGDVICTLENPSFIELQQTYLDSYAQVQYLHAEYLRQQTLAQEDAASQKKFQQSRADYLSMKSRMDATAARLQLLGISIETLQQGGIEPLLRIKAPINGYVTDLQMNIGKHFAAGEPLCEIIDKSRAMLCLTAYEKDMDKINVGDSVEFRVNGITKEYFTGRVHSISQQVDDTNRSIDVYVNISKQDTRFKPGMYVTARILRK